MGAKSERLEAKQSMAEGQMSEAKKKWAAERKEIMQTFGGQIPSFIVESDRLRKDLANMRNKNEALEASLEVISENLATQLQKLQIEKKNEEQIAAQTAEHNVELQRRCRDLQIEKLELETEIAKNAEMQSQNPKEYPPESTVIQNLLQAQCEFYFSDYNLKRDKRLLADVVAEPRKGFLALDEVMKLSWIRQLCTERETLEEALRRSNILTLIHEQTTDDEKSEQVFVGRLDFEKPKEKEFPFRRTVFLFGIPSENATDFLKEML